MSAEKGRRFYDVTIEPSAAAFLQATSQSSRTRSSERADLHDSPATLPNCFALNFNFKPDSTHDCKMGALFQAAPSHNPAADWQLELDDDKPATATDSPNGSTKKSAHVFTGPQTAAKSYDVVLVWDQAAQTYRLDRVAATFALKYERSKTTLSAQSQQVWQSDTNRARKRPAGDSSASRPVATTQDKDRRGRCTDLATSQRREPLAQCAQIAGKASLSSSSSSNGGLRLRSRKGLPEAPLRRSSRGVLPVEMEEFDDHQREASSPQASRSEPESSSNTKKSRILVPDVHPAPTPESVSGLRRSRRHSTQIQEGDMKSPPPDVQAEQPNAQAVASEDPDADDGTGGEDDDLALELERELERELDIDMNDASEDDKPASPPRGRSAAPTTSRALSPASRLKASDRQSKVSTPKAHTPEVEDMPSTARLTAMDDAPTYSTPSASIGLGLHQTGVGITPTASPHLETASPKVAAMELGSCEEDQRGEACSRKDDGALEGAPDEDDDDDLDDFAAELDMSLAEVPDPGPVMERRRSSRSLNSIQSNTDFNVSTRPQRLVRKAYGLGGPRQEEEELEDSD